MASRSVLRLFLVVLAFGFVSAQHVPVAFAQADMEKRVRSMNKQAMADYDALEFELARKTLMDAVSLVRQAGLDETPVAAKTYLNLGVVYVAGFKDRNRGLQQFVQALKINPNLKLDPSVASPELDEVFAAARKQVGGGAPTREPTPEPDSTRGGGEDVKGLAHTPVEEMHSGEPVTIRAQLGSDTGASRVYVLYRSSGQADYTPLQMAKNDGEWVAVIPADAIEDRPLQYYLEARDRRGRAVVGSGSAANPYIVMFSEGAPGARIVRPSEKKKEEDKSKFHRMFVFLMPGFGFGYHPAGNQTEVAYQLKSSSSGGADRYERTAVKEPGGVAIAPFHLSVELGGMITRGFSLSVVGRFELVTGANAQTVATDSGGPPIGGTSRANGAIAGFVRARYRFLSGKLHPYVAVTLGGGEIRHALDLSNAWQNDNPLVDQVTADAYNMAIDRGQTPSVDRQRVCQTGGECKDSLKLGYLFIGGGAGLWYDVWKYIGLILDVNVLGGIGVGSGQSGLNVDIQLGVGATFL